MSTGGKDTSSSSGVVFAKASKEWVLPSRAKPGRKAAPKKGESSQAAAPSPTPSTSTPTSTTTHNREAQRAFRERKSSYLTSLEARIEAYERGEVEKNIKLQQTARGIKEDNNRLKEEVREAREECDALRRVLGETRDREEGLLRQLRELQGRVGSGSTSMLENPTLSMSRMRQQQHPDHISWSASPNNPTLSSTTLPHPYIKPDPSLPPPLHPITPPSDTASSSSSSSPPPASTSSHKRPAPTPMESYIRSPPTSSPSHSHPSDTDLHGGTGRIEISPCGFCTGLETVCVCRMVAEEEALSAGQRSSSSPIVHSHGVEPASLFSRPPPQPASTSLLDNPPPPEAAVPLRLKKRATGVAKVPIFAVAPAEVVEVVKKARLAECSGDPANCDACRDDTWGRQFCERLASQVCCGSSSQRCANCSSSNSPAIASSPSSFSLPGPSSFVSPVSTCSTCAAAIGQCVHTRMEVEGREKVVEEVSSGYMGADEAWRTLKAHPNARFASLSLLADVVSRRTRCIGEKVELSPPRQMSPGMLAGPSSEVVGVPRMVPLEELVVAGKKRRLEVQADGVKEALALLDSQSDKYKRRKMSGEGEYM